jgi:hypothetical protein
MSIRRPMTAGNSRAGTVLRPRVPIRLRHQPIAPPRSRLLQLVHPGSQLQLARPHSRVPPVPPRNRPRIARLLHRAQPVPPHNRLQLVRPQPGKPHNRRGTCRKKRPPGIVVNRVPRERSNFSEVVDNLRRGAAVFNEAEGAAVRHAVAGGNAAAGLSGLTAVCFGTRGQVRLTPGGTMSGVRAGSNGFQNGYRSSDRISES